MLIQKRAAWAALACTPDVTSVIQCCGLDLHSGRRGVQVGDEYCRRHEDRRRWKDLRRLYPTVMTNQGGYELTSSTDAGSLESCPRQDDSAGRGHRVVISGRSGRLPSSWRDLDPGTSAC